MDTIVTLATLRSHYSAQDAAERSLTVRELIEALEQFDEDAKVVFCNDNGYTYGYLSWQTFGEYVEED